ncbi:hypothetical protein DMN91_012723 [Ooceraea biroi]|uniref:Peptidase aspartic putative domain-containing protein n=1 Tax=Ooceraea biroi TaxID=2015173 RepID=A0A3L8D3N2_OOCBI|nr:uncharacterized protein LOC105283521 [Ooceraea biroi]RLU14836.1 hypothetical protein DMN91_012723 [Ooceraea biroi]
MATVGSTINKQNDLFGRIARVFINTKKLGTDKLNRFNLDARIKTLNADWERFQSNHDKLIGSLMDEIRKLEYFTDDLYAKCEEAYFNSVSSIMQLREAMLEQDQTAADSANATPRTGPSRSLPKIQLPKFTGNYHEWPTFRDLFSSMVVSNPDISRVEKLHYLKSQVSGEAARFLANLTITADNFSRAWDSLTSRYENKRLLVSANLDRLFELKLLTQAFGSDLKHLLATVKESLGALQALGVPVDQWDIFIVYFVTRKLDPKFLEAWEIHLGESTDLVTFDKLETFLESRIHALEVVGSRNNSSKTTSASKSISKSKSSARSHAAVVSHSGCSCCTAAHYIASCPDFAAKSLDERHDFVSRKNLCYNCLGAHRLTDCRCVKRCRRCKGNYHSFLHRDSVSVPASGNPTTPPPVSMSSNKSDISNKVVAQSLHAASNLQPNGPAVLLATARVRLITDNNHSIEVRVLLDQGSKVSHSRVLGAVDASSLSPSVAVAGRCRI